MKKNLTKLVSILMVLVMMVGLSGCSNEKNAVLGSWKASMNLAEYLNQGIAQEDATAAEYLSVDSFYLTMVLTFKEDNTYTITLDENSVDAAVEQLKTDIRGGMERYLVDMMAQMGVVMTIDEIMKASNTTMDKLMDEFFSDEMVEQMVGGASSEGKFKAKSGRIFLSAGLDYEVDPNVYGIYKVDGSTLTILDYVGEDENFLGMYPITFTKAG